MIGFWTALPLACLAWADPAAPPAASTAAFVSPSTATYASVSGIIDKVRIHRKNVFDPSVPGENLWPFRMANKIHIPTKEYVLRREILIGPGEAWDSRRILESERNLRNTDFIRNAEIKASTTSADRIDLDLYSQDSWTLSPQLSVGTEGGQNYFIYGISENNLLGYGKSVSILRGNFDSDHRNEFRYHDPRLIGSRVSLTGLYATNQYGDQIGALVEQPFFSLDTPFGWRALWARTVQQNFLYQNADQTNDFTESARSVDLTLGRKIGESEDLIQRLYAGIYYEKIDYQPTSTTLPGTIHPGRENSGPVAGYQLIQERYIKETYIDSMQRVEDFNLGNEFNLRAGALMQSWGSDADRWSLTAVDQQGLSLGSGRFILAQAGVQGRMRHDHLENSIFFSNLNLFWKSVWPIPQTWVAHAEANMTKNLYPENQLILGGNTGLRGYKNNSFTGTRSALLNLEDRVFLIREFFHLFYVGGVAFFEMGAVSPTGSGFTWNWLKSDAGFGFRFSPTRSTSGTVFRMDVAYALNGGPGPTRWVASVRGGQAFSIFNSTNREVLRSPSDTISSSSSGTTLHRQ